MLDKPEQLHPRVEDPLLRLLRHLIRWAVKALAILMVAVILFGVIDVVYLLYLRLNTEPFLLLEITDILATFGAFMAVLIAIEIFENITVYLRDDVIQVKIVMATALMAIARKVIILDIKEVEPLYVFGLAASVLAMSIGYWLVVVYERKHTPFQSENSGKGY
ncbi:MAG: phosphate-starvation-inducible PsiE family protein [Candidatus Hydrogenedentota bacterium]